MKVCRSRSRQINYIEKLALYEAVQNYRPPWNEKGAYRRTRQVDGERSIAQEWEFSRAAVYASAINREIHLSLDRVARL